MRIRDLKSYILILIFLLVCFLGCNIMYEISISGASLDNALYQSESNLYSTKSLLDLEINNYYTSFVTSNSEYELITIIDDSLFSNSNYIINDSLNVEGIDDGYYLYLKNENNYTKISLNTILVNVYNNLEIESLDPIMLVSTNGIILGCNLDYNTNDFKTVLEDTNESYVVNNFINALNSDNVYSSSVNIKVSKNEILEGYMSITNYLDVMLVRVIESSLVNSSYNNLTKIRWAYIGGISLILVLAIIVFILLFRKLSKSNSIDAGVNAKTSNIVLITKSDGKILKYNKPFKVAFPNHIVPIKSLDELNLVKGTNIKNLIKEQKSFVLVYSSEEEHVYFEFLSIKRGSDYSIIGRVITDEYKEEQILIKNSTKSIVTNDDNDILLDRYYRETKNKFLTFNDPYVFVITNLKGFKNVNALLGFKAGNDVLLYFSRKLHEIYEGYHVFHISGDEFVLLSQTDNEEGAYLKSERILDELKAPIEINNNEIMLRPAIGILASDMDRSDVISHDNLIDKLRIACEKAKKSTSKSIQRYDINLENASIKDREMEEDLKQAIQKNEFVMFYQPQYEINQERVCGFEALLRWNNPKYAGISPQIYIELAEKNGFIIDVGNFITRDVLKTAKEMEQYDVHISVNVSPAQIVQAGFVADLLDEFDRNNLQPGSIALEVTETFLMENFQSVVEKLKILKNRGISIHLDDFGTGYSSMLYLKELPIDTIKVDKEFIKHIETDRFSKVLTSKIISLGKELGDKVICEGVETKIQKDIVSKFGADIIQGYYIGKALSKEDAFSLLKTGKVSSENKTSAKVGGSK